MRYFLFIGIYLHITSLISFWSSWVSLSRQVTLVVISHSIIRYKAKETALSWVTKSVILMNTPAHCDQSRRDTNRSWSKNKLSLTHLLNPTWTRRWSNEHYCENFHPLYQVLFLCVLGPLLVSCSPVPVLPSLGSVLAPLAPLVSVLQTAAIGGGGAAGGAGAAGAGAGN